MPYGFFIVEEWTESPRGKKGAWRPILHLDASHTMTKAMLALQKLGKAGLYRVMQMQRCVWAEMENGTLRLHGSHIFSAESLGEMVEIFQREGGRRPVEKAREQRKAAKAKRSKGNGRNRKTMRSKT